MTNGTTIALLGAVTAGLSFMTGRFMVTRTQEWAADVERKNGGKPYDLAQLHRAGKFMMWNAPILLAIFVGIGLSGIADG